MAVFTILDTLKTISFKEKNGVIRNLVRSCIITGLNGNTDYTVLLSAYQQVGLPNPGSFLITAPLAPPFPPSITYPTGMLVLADRDFRVADDKNTVEVLLTYEHFMDGDNQNLSILPESPNGWVVQGGGIVFGKARASVQQSKANYINSNYILASNGQQIPEWEPDTDYPAGSIVDYNGFYWTAQQDLIQPVIEDFAGIPEVITGFDYAVAPPPGPVGSPIGEFWDFAIEGVEILNIGTPTNPGLRRQVIVGHQFPSNDPNVPGKTVYQGGEFTTMEPNENIKLHGQLYIRNPKTIKRQFLRAINKFPWNGEPAYTWMCTEITWEPLYPVTGLAAAGVVGQWRFSFEFQNNPDTWLPEVTFNDQRTGRPPPNLIQGFGYRQLHYHPEVDFATFFASNLIGSLELGA